MIKVYPAAGARLQTLQVGEHTLVFGPERWADGSMLSQEELDRLIRFHFHIERVDEEWSDDNAPADKVDAVEDAKDIETSEETASAPRRRRAKQS
ncbi:hypothetical protein [Alicyclobacillus sendaiensis]|uniref:hypothetical protein n=1 Tax=Alicyclobacillus sendaiensis TaxID=192387 RepID=UPI0026F41306|nr:hypothetical protein [Alicyclobacillus sendaiensis]